MELMTTRQNLCQIVKEGTVSKKDKTLDITVNTLQ